MPTNEKETALKKLQLAKDEYNKHGLGGDWKRLIMEAIGPVVASNEHRSGLCPFGSVPRGNRD